MSVERTPQYVYFPLIWENHSNGWQVYKDEKEGVAANIKEGSCCSYETKENQLGSWSLEDTSGRSN